MEEDTNNDLLGAKKRLGLLSGSLNLKTISSGLVKALQKDPKKCHILSESALIVIQSLPPKISNLIDDDKLDVEGKLP